MSELMVKLTFIILLFAVITTLVIHCPVLVPVSPLLIILVMIFSGVILYYRG